MFTQEISERIKKRWLTFSPGRELASKEKISCDRQSVVHFIQQQQKTFFFSSTQETFYQHRHILGLKSSFIRFKRIQVLKIMFSENSRMKLEINNRNVLGIFPHVWELNNTLLITVPDG